MQFDRCMFFAQSVRWAALGLLWCLAARGALAAGFAPPEGWRVAVAADGEHYRWEGAATPHRLEVFRSVAVGLPNDNRLSRDAALARWLDEQVRRDAPAHGESLDCMAAVIKQLGARRAVAAVHCHGQDRQHRPLRLQYLGLADPAHHGAALMRVVAVGDDAGLAAQRPQLDAVMSSLLPPP